MRYSAYRQKQREDHAEFCRATRNHEMQILEDGERFRHVRFKTPGTMNYYYDLISWPGHLTICGDIGTYTFCQTHDMFEFFRARDSEDTIDYRYWAEKCEAADKTGGLTEYDGDALRSAAVRVFMQSRDDLPEGRRLALWQDFRQTVLEELSGEDERTDMEMVMGWSYQNGSYSISFSDFYQWGPFKSLTFTFRMCCWAIREGISAYDAGGTRPQRAKAHYARILKGKL